jgi:bifunctional non-homologous end joining protein LigD
MERRQRHGKVFVDWSQNADYKTTVCVYSLRAKRRHPYVSMPVRWEELEAALANRDGSPLYFSPQQAVDRLSAIGDLFEPVLRLKQALPDAFESAAVKRGINMRSPSQAVYAEGKLLHMPGPSSQGGRRKLSIAPLTSGRALELRLQFADQQRCFQLAKALPRKVGESVSADLVQVGTPMGGADEKTGTFELIEGSVKRGFLDLFLTTDEFRGEWLFSAADDDKWIVRRPRKDESGLSFEMGDGTQSEPRAHHATVKAKAIGEDDRAAEIIPWKGGRSDEVEHLPRAKPEFIVPMECRLAAKVPDGTQWLYELKLDGYRAIAVKDEKTDLLSRYGRSFANRFGEIVSALDRMEIGPCVLDGEVVALDAKGRPSFQELQNSRSTRQPIVYYVFDIVNYDGYDLKGLSLVERRKVLEKVAGKFVEPVRLAAALHANASEFVSQVRHFGLEGVVAKRRDSMYEAGKRPGSWVKYRVNEREEFVIGGYRSAGSMFDAILVGRFDGDRLKFVEKVKNGFVPATRKQVFDAVQGLIINECPFVNLPEKSKRRGAVDSEEMRECVWLRPVQVCEIEFVEWTRGGHLRHASFRQLADRLSGAGRHELAPKHVV